MKTWYEIKLKRCEDRCDVLAVIKGFLDEDYVRGAGFASSVLIEHRISDDDIYYCMRDLAIKHFAEFQLMDIRLKHQGSAWDCSNAMIKFMGHQKEVWDFLYKLIDVPEHIRLSKHDPLPQPEGAWA